MTRLIWVIIFAVLVAVLVIVSLRSLPGAGANRQLVEVGQARETLSRMFPDSRFRVQLSNPAPGVRNLVVTIQPGQADSASVAAQVDSAESVTRRRVDLSNYDSLVIAVFDRVHRAIPVR